MNFKLPIISLIICLMLTGCYKTAEEMHIETGTVTTENEKSKNEIISQNRWLYHQMNENYFWYKDMPDSSKLDFNQLATSFFEKIKSPKDRFSWIEPNLGYSGESSILYDFGMEYQEYKTNDGVVVYRVLLVIPNSPTYKAGVKRGDWFIPTHNLSENPDKRLKVIKGEIRNGKFFPIGIVNISAGINILNTTAVLLDTMYSFGSHHIGYMVYNEFMDSNGNASNPYRIELRNIFSQFKKSNITDFVIDLRYNPGGLVSICQYLGSLILADEYLGKISGFHRYNDKLTKIQYIKTGNEEDILKFPSKTSVGGNNLGIDRIYAIVSKNTASASECLINSLKPFIEIVTIGTTTYGKGVGSVTIQDEHYKWQIQPIMFQYYNALHQTVPETGLIPDIIADETSIGTYFELGDAREYLLNIALNEIVNTQTKSAGILNKLSILPTGNTSIHNRRFQGLILLKQDY